jgi:hypothetical protein
MSFIPGMSMRETYGRVSIPENKLGISVVDNILRTIAF